MAVDHHLLDNTDEDEEEDYIDMEVSSTSNLFFYPKSTSPKHTNEFEFQMFSSFSDRETTSPADELFYKGKLLPLHLPPRLQMFEKLLQNSSPFNNTKQFFEDEHFNTSLTTTAYATPDDNTPYDSCNISPCESPKVRKELRQDESISFTSENPKKSWAKKLKLGLKLKASHAYLKSFFNKSNGSDSSFAGENWNELAQKTAMASPKNPFGQIHREKCQKSSIVSKSYKTDKTALDGIFHHRRSFSGAIRLFSKTKSLSLSQSSSSFQSSYSSSSSNFANSNGLSDSFECSIQGAIAHCKRSQEEFRIRKTVSEVGLYNLSTSSLLACEIQDKPVLCRG